MKKDPELFSEGQTTLRGRDWSSQLKKNRPSYIKAQGMKDIKWGEQVWWLTTAWCFCMQWWRMVNASPRLLLCSSLGGKNCLSGEYGLFLNTWCFYKTNVSNQHQALAEPYCSMEHIDTPCTFRPSMREAPALFSDRWPRGVRDSSMCGRPRSSCVVLKSWDGLLGNPKGVKDD